MERGLIRFGPIPIASSRFPASIHSVWRIELALHSRLERWRRSFRADADILSNRSTSIQSRKPLQRRCVSASQWQCFCSAFNG